MRTAIVNPGSASWWLVSLTPLLYFDSIRVAKADLDAIVGRRDASAYHTLTARILDALRAETGDDLIVPDVTLPPRGRNIDLEEQADRMTTLMIDAAGAWQPTQPTLLRPGELKHLLSTAYGEYLRYSRRKMSLLPRLDPLREELSAHHIPQSAANHRRVREIAANRLPDVLERDQPLRTVLVNIVRNALLLLTLGDGQQRLYDALAEEFIPAVEAVDRFLVLDAGGREGEAPPPWDLLVKVHQIHMRNMALSATNCPPESGTIVIRALKERRRFATLRKRLAELDDTARGFSPDERGYLVELLKLVRSLKEEVERVDRMASALMWASRTYFLTELLAGVDSGVAHVIKLAVSNPVTTEALKTYAKNLHLASRGLRRGAPAALAMTRDYLAVRRMAPIQGPLTPASYQFWV